MSAATRWETYMLHETLERPINRTDSAHFEEAHVLRRGFRRFLSLTVCLTEHRTMSVSCRPRVVLVFFVRVLVQQRAHVTLA